MREAGSRRRRSYSIKVTRFRHFEPPQDTGLLHNPMPSTIGASNSAHLKGKGPPVSSCRQSNANTLIKVDLHRALHEAAVIDCATSTNTSWAQMLLKQCPPKEFHQSLASALVSHHLSRDFNTEFIVGNEQWGEQNGSTFRHLCV